MLLQNRLDKLTIIFLGLLIVFITNITSVFAQEALPISITYAFYEDKIITVTTTGTVPEEAIATVRVEGGILKNGTFSPNCSVKITQECSYELDRESKHFAEPSTHVRIYIKYKHPNESTVYSEPTEISVQTIQTEFCSTYGLSPLDPQPTLLPNREICADENIVPRFEKGYEPPNLVLVQEALKNETFDYYIWRKDTMIRSELITDFVALLNEVNKSKSCKPWIADGYRSWDAQAAVDPNNGAAPGNSIHQAGIAFDLYCQDQGYKAMYSKTMALRDYVDFKKFGFVQPDPGDTPHFVYIRDGSKSESTWKKALSRFFHNTFNQFLAK